MKKYKIPLLFLGASIFISWTCAQFTTITYTGVLIRPRFPTTLSHFSLLLAAISWLYIFIRSHSKSK